MRNSMLTRIISGGQTGVDRGALDAALASGFPCGGSCPLGRRAEDGAIPERYPLTEIDSASYPARTRQNAADADGTLVIFFGGLSGGTAETLRICQALGRPVLTVDGSAKTPELAAVEAMAFVAQNAIAVLNVAGPRESSHAGAAQYARAVVRMMLRRG